MCILSGMSCKGFLELFLNCNVSYDQFFLFGGYCSSRCLLRYGKEVLSNKSYLFSPGSCGILLLTVGLVVSYGDRSDVSIPY